MFAERYYRTEVDNMTPFMIAKRQNVDIDVIIAANKTPDRYPELVKHSKLKLHTNILLEIPQHISCDTDRHGLLQSSTINKNSTINTEQNFLIRKQNACQKSEVRSYFLNFVPTIRELRDFYREM
eukprot:SAG31_NODE_9763_length_1221_cov_2.581786_2_plen_125_part_00